MSIVKQRRMEVDKARQFFRTPQSSEERKARIVKLKQRLPCARCGKDDNECPAKVKVANWEEIEEQATEEPHQFPIITFLSHMRERWATTSGVIGTARALTLAGTRWFEKFEVELKRHATLSEVVSDSGTFQFRPGAVKKFSCSYFPDCCGTKRVPLRASLLDEEVSLLIIMEMVRQLRSVIDVAEKTIEFRTFQNAKVPLEVVAGHLTLDLKPKRASALQKQLTPQMNRHVRDRSYNSSTVFRKHWFGLIICYPSS